MKIRIKEDQQTPQAIFMAGPAGEIGRAHV